MSTGTESKYRFGDSKYSATCLVSTWVSTLHSVPNLCTMLTSTDSKYRFGVPFKVITKEVGL